MSTLKEKLEKKVAEGFETARFCIRAKVGESKMLCLRTSVYYDDLRDRARLLEASIDQVEDELAEFSDLLVAEPAAPEKQVAFTLGGLGDEGATVDVSVSPSGDITKMSGFAALADVALAKVEEMAEAEVAKRSASTSVVPESTVVKAAKKKRRQV